jgi:hypothetical protein
MVGDFLRRVRALRRIQRIADRIQVDQFFLDHSHANLGRQNANHARFDALAGQSLVLDRGDNGTNSALRIGRHQQYIGARLRARAPRLRPN